MLTLNESFALQHQGRFDEAEQGYRALIEREPGNTDAVLMLAVLLRQRGNTVEAEDLFERASRALPGEGDLQLHLASTRYANGKIEEARLGYARALELNPNLVGAHVGLGQLALNDGNDTLAENHFRIALKAQEDGHALAGLGHVMALRSDWDAALRYLTRAVELIPDNAFANYQLGQAFARKGLTTFARQAFEKTLQLAPNINEAHAWLSQILFEEGQYRAAEKHYAHLLSVPGYDLHAYAGLGDIARAENRMEDAVAHYRAVLAIDPTHKMPMRMLTVALATLGRNDEVVATFGDYLARKPDDDEIREIRAGVLASLGRNREAAADWGILVRRRPEDAQGHARIAVLEEQLGQLDKALDHAERALRFDPANVDARLVLARAQTRKGEHAAARATLDGLARAALSPEQALQQERALGFAHDATGEHADAVHRFADAQRGMAVSMPPLAEPRQELAAALEEPVGEPWSHAPVLLLGAPGSGVEQVAALLADQPGLQVLRGRSSSLGRADDFNHPRFQLYCGELNDAAREALRERYLSPMRESGMDISRTIVDWLPRWDAHLLALVRRAMPGSRLLIVDADARDELLNWLAFGWVNGFACADVDAGADWLARARRHIAYGAQLDDPRRLVVRADDLVADGDAAQKLARFLGLDALDFDAQAQRLGSRPRGRFAAGHWQAYRDTLAGPFAKLATA